MDQKSNILRIAVAALILAAILGLEHRKTGIVQPLPPTTALTATELRYRILDQYPDIHWCDPDFYPIAREDELAAAKSGFSGIQQNVEEYQVILKHLGIAKTTAFTDEEILKIYQEHKKLNRAFSFEPQGIINKFVVTTGEGKPAGSRAGAYRIEGTIDQYGTITETKKIAGPPIACPICLAKNTLIDTPSGKIPVQSLKVGMAVWTVDVKGHKEAGVILKISRTSVPPDHKMVHLKLTDGRELFVSPGHPTADGRRVGELAAGDILDGVRVKGAERVSYSDRFTYDILPSGESHAYWANGILVGSTLSGQ